MVKKSNQKKASTKATNKIEAQVGKWVNLPQVGHVSASLMPKNKDYPTPAVHVKFGFGAKSGMVIPLTKANLDEIRGSLDIIEAQCL